MAQKNHEEETHEETDFPRYEDSAAMTLDHIRVLCSKHLDLQYLQDFSPDLHDALIDRVASYFAEELSADLAQAPPNERLQVAKAMFHGIAIHYIYYISDYLPESP